MIFIDSSVYVAFYNKDDSQHQKAVGVLEKVASGNFGNEVTSDYVFDETVTVTLSRTKDKKTAINAGSHILESTHLLDVHGHVFDASWKLFKENDDGLSFTDSSAIALMNLFNIEHIATFDRAFKSIEGIKVVDS